MFEKKQILVLLAAAVLVSACGGGNSDGGGVGSSMSAAPTADTGTPSPTNSGGTGTAGAPTPDTGSTPPPTNDSGGNTSTSNDQQLRGYLSMVANQLVYIRTDRSIYHAITLDQFESNTGMYDIASGSDGDDANTPVPPPATAPAAPVAAFGFRVDKFVQRETDGQVVGNQTAVGRIAFNLTERDDSPGILANEVAENMKFVIDKVELSTDEKGELVSVRALDGAQMYIYGRNAARVEVQDTIPVPAGAVRLLPMSNVLDHLGDNSSTVLLLDLESAFSQAGQRLAALENIAGHFSMQVTMSPAQMVRPAAEATGESPALPRRDLVGQQITVNNQAPVSGAGISGNAWIRMYPPPQ